MVKSQVNGLACSEGVIHLLPYCFQNHDLKADNKEPQNRSYNIQQYFENETKNVNPFMNMSFSPGSSTCAAAASKSASNGSSKDAELEATVQILE